MLICATSPHSLAMVRTNDSLIFSVINKYFIVYLFFSLIRKWIKKLKALDIRNYDEITGGFTYMCRPTQFSQQFGYGWFVSCVD